MKPCEIKNRIYWVGAIDYSLRNFHGHTYNARRGTTYNAYLIIDDKITLVDTVLGPFAGQMIENIKQITDPARIDYLVANHVEADHSGALPEILKYNPRIKVFGSPKCKEGLQRHYYPDNLDFTVVKTSDTLNLGKRDLTFIEAPMLHWPDSMFTYCAGERLLLPNDAFGQHYASSQRFDDEVDPCQLMDEAARYYANILWPFSSLVLKKLDDLNRLNIKPDIIAPSHGIIWRKDPAKIINAYRLWASGATNAKVVMVYETMWGSTEKMAFKISEALADEGLDVRVFDVAGSDRTEIIKEMLDAKGILIGSSTHDNGILPTIAGFLEFFKGLRPKNRLGAAFGSYGWAGGAVKQIEDILRQAGLEVAQSGMGFQYAPSQDDLAGCYRWGRAFASAVKAARETEKRDSSAPQKCGASE